MITNTIGITLLDASLAVKEKYGPKADIIKYNKGNSIRYRFENIPPIRNFPYGFKSVEKAMNCLKLHECGYVGWKRSQRKLKREAKPDAFVNDLFGW